MTPAHCPGCHCVIDAPAHVLVAALVDDDILRALDLGLLDSHGCPSCSATCTSRLLAARDDRRAALAARERYRARQARLARRAAEKAAARAPQATPGRPPLPAAAADALARAMARAKGGRA